LAGAGTAISGIPHAPIATERFRLPLATIHRTWPGDLPAAGRLGDAPIRGQLLQFQAEQPVIGGQHRTAQLLGYTGADPLIAVAPQGVVDLAGGQQRRDLDPEGFQDRRWQGRHETSR
jgi:hypothetical protein